MLDFHLADLAWLIFAAVIATAYKAGGIVTANSKTEKSMRADIIEMKHTLESINTKFDTQFTGLRDRVIRIEEQIKIGGKHG